MARPDDFGPRFAIDGPPRRRISMWPAVVLLAVLLFEVSADPAFSVAVMAFKLGSGDFLTARWIRKADPDVGRGKTCSWFFLTVGLMRVTVAVIILMMMAFLAFEIARKTMPVPPPPPREVLGSMVLFAS